MAQLSKALAKLRDQANTLAPNRNKSSDGTFPSAQHLAQSPNSDHNTGDALDLTHDSHNGFDSYKIAEQLRLSKDPRISYVISNRRIFSNTIQPWTWRPYSGSNPHSSHVHISVQKLRRDDEGLWNLGAPMTPDTSTPVAAIIELGSQGTDVKTLQQQLGLDPNGLFGPETEQRVKSLQAARSLVADGIVGPETRKALQVSRVWRFENITATVFGGQDDPQQSAYDEKWWISDTDLTVSLPARIRGTRPQVLVEANGKSVLCRIGDVGPWNTIDDYWTTGKRPRSETQFGAKTPADNKHVPTNDAGIDLSPAAARAIGLEGKDKVSWSFYFEPRTSISVEPRVPAEEPGSITPTPSFEWTPIINIFTEWMRKPESERSYLRLGLSLFPHVGPLLSSAGQPNSDLSKMLDMIIMAGEVAKKLKTFQGFDPFSAIAGWITSTPIPTTSPPPPPTVKTVPKPSPLVQKIKAEPISTLAAPTGFAGLLITFVLQTFEVLGPAFGPDATLSGLLSTLLTSLTAGLGVANKTLTTTKKEPSR